VGKTIGEMLVAEGVINPQSLQKALAHAGNDERKTAESLYELGLVDENTLANYASRMLGVPFAVLSESAINLTALGSIPLEMAKKMGVIPLRRQEQDLFIGMFNPHDVLTLDEIRFVTGAQVIEYGVFDFMLNKIIDVAYEQSYDNANQFWQGHKFSPRPLGEMGYLEVVVGKTPITIATQVETEALPQEEPPIFEIEDLGIIELPPPIKKQGDKPVVMVVDDDASIRSMVCTYFDKMGYEILEAEDGTKALSILQNQLPDIIVLDAMLPGVHGFDICRQVKNTSVTSHIPVVMISAIYRGWGYATDITQKYGADAFLEKPLSLKELKRTVKQALDQKKDAVSNEELSSKAAEAVNAAAIAFGQGDLPLAASQLQKAIEASPFSALLHRKLASVYNKLEEPHRAIAEMERVVQLSNTYQHVYELACLFEKNGFTHRAFESFEKCIKLTANDQEIDKVKERMQKLIHSD
jgi:DNA-binding response OmpR family regulator